MPTPFCRGLSDAFCLEARLGIHLLETAVFVLQFLEAGHEGIIHPAKFGSPVLEGGRADAMLAAEFWDG